jgi:hypothetical protein
MHRERWRSAPFSPNSRPLSRRNSPKVYVARFSMPSESRSIFGVCSNLAAALGLLRRRGSASGPWINYGGWTRGADTQPRFCSFRRSAGLRSGSRPGCRIEGTGACIKKDRSRPTFQRSSTTNLGSMAGSRQAEPRDDDHQQSLLIADGPRHDPCSTIGNTVRHPGPLSE